MKVKFGLSNVHIAPRIEDEQGNVSYGTPVALNGAVNLSLEPQEEESTFYADNIKYWNAYISSGYTGDLEVALVPDWFKVGYLGYMEDTLGNLVATNKQGGAFGLMFQVETDTENIKYAIYNCVASKPSLEYATIEENAEPQTQTMSMSMSGETVGDVQAYITEVTNFDSLELPTFASI